MNEFEEKLLRELGYIAGALGGMVVMLFFIMLSIGA